MIYDLLIMIYCIVSLYTFSLTFNCVEERDVDLCFGEKYIYKC